ncbi:beta,beta-carotene 15,15'-dioxygenase-like [Mizuhopecten yessoensis]|uniref:Beta,beta-carotene 15,15'-monooxygenase n=1 Tax=Mizuhopecten yessoensis TaxID=6573 RepID=A0A210Q9Y1_MIZYE|nr:beta,beta-carotene 15,15'-dioxygenase-like [Mizuhopecten yessoensis]OWF45550.1 Beta,beta-carotene 15,15'-monooxygenase [Mizuhopecten yessoensis]
MTISEGFLGVLACALLLLFVSVAGDDGAEGFETWFTTNKDEMENTPIYFDNPLPKWLKGTLIRNGPGQFEMGQRKFLNAIDGYAKLSSWAFPGNGSAYFSTKFIRSKSYVNAVSKDDILPFLSFDAVDPPFNDFQKLESVLNELDNMNVNVYKFLDQGKPVFAALSDTWKLYEVNESLTTLKSVNVPHPEKVPAENVGFITSMSCAHPVNEYGSSDTYFNFYTSLSLTPGVKHRLTLVRIKSMVDRQVIAEWETDKAAYMHSFSVTPNYVIFFVAPYYINIEELLMHASVKDGLDWFSKENTSVYIVNIKTGQIHDMAIPNMMALHHINAFEFPDGRIVVDVAAHRDPFFSTAFKMSTIHNATARASIKTTNLVKRFIFDIERNRYTEQTFKDSDKYQCASKLEVPTVNENYRSKPYCFVYGGVYNYDGKDFAHIPLVKKDLCSQQGDKALYIPNHYPTEAWFIPLPPEVAKTEDDGYLISSFLDGTTKQSYVAIIDPKNMTITHKAMLPTVVPFTIHGRFFQDSV